MALTKSLPFFHYLHYKYKSLYSEKKIPVKTTAFSEEILPLSVPCKLLNPCSFPIKKYLGFLTFSGCNSFGTHSCRTVWKHI